MEQQLQFSENYEEKYQHYEHSVGTIMLHLEWCTKYRYKMFRKEENKNLLCDCIRKAVSLHDIKIIELNVQSEHIHCIVLVKFSLSVSKVLQLLKGISSKLFFEYQEKARLRYPRGNLWSRGKFASSVGFVQLDVVRNYVKTQEIVILLLFSVLGYLVIVSPMINAKATANYNQGQIDLITNMINQIQQTGAVRLPLGNNQVLMLIPYSPNQ